MAKRIEIKLILLLTTSIFLFQNCKREKKADTLNYKTNKHKSLITADLINEKDSSIYSIVEKMPIFKGCEFEEYSKKCSDKKLVEYIHKNIKYKSISKGDGVESMIICSFVIEKDGTTSNIKLLKGNNLSNIEYLINKMPLWIPGENEMVLKNRTQKLCKFVYHEKGQIKESYLYEV